MKFIIIMFLFSVLTSCLKVSFNQPQPKDGIRLTEFPSELKGTWTREDGDFLTFHKAGVETASLIYDSLENLIDTAYRYTGLSDSIRIYQGGKYYVINEQSSNDSWNFMVFRLDGRGNIYHYLCDDIKFYSKLNGLKIDSASYKIHHYNEVIDELYVVDTTIYEPETKELLKINTSEINWVYFNGQIRIQDLRKITTRKNLIEIYRTNGVIEVAKKFRGDEEDESEEKEEIIEN